jgi:DNA-binding NtrC family response regulator
MKLNQKIIERKREIGIALVLFLALLLFSFPNVSDTINYSLESTFYKIAGEDKVDTNIVIIKITEKDISALGGWPLKRSYYALLINKLNKLDVAKIGVEIFLAINNNNQNIYNNLIFNEISKKNNIVFSAIVNDLKESNGKYSAKTVLLPSLKAEHPECKVGHINFVEVNGYVVPSTIIVKDDEVKSFSQMLAGTLENEKIKINFHSSFSSFKSYSLLEFFTASENNREIGQKFKNKIVLIGVTDKTIGKSVSTSFDERLAGIGLHAFAVDNILANKGLKDNYYNLSFILFFVLLLVFTFVVKKWKQYLYILSLFVLLVVSYILFVFSFVELNYSAFAIPLTLLIIFELYLFYAERGVELVSAFSENELLQKTILQKESKLAELQKEFASSSEPPTELLAKIDSLKQEIQEIKSFNEANTIPHQTSGELEKKDFFGIIYAGKAMQNVVDMIKKVAPTDASILIIGESGSGKELVANAIHQLSNRKKKEIVAFNCAAIPENLLESELFGHVKGAFTDASKDKIGRFEAADNGTIFLDEIGETTDKFQAKLLRVLQSGELQKVGSTETQIVNVRVVAATNKKLAELVKEKKFREDLYYRLNVITIEVPTLDKRCEDIPFIAQYFAKQEDESLEISSAVMEVLKENKWSGNVRELESNIKRASIFAKSEGRKIIQLCDLPENIAKNSRKDLRQLILDSLREKNFSHSSISETAKELGNISRTIVAENFRGIFLEEYYKSNFNFDFTIKEIGDTSNPIVLKQISKKGRTYLDNIEKGLEGVVDKSFEIIKQKFTSKYKNLPQKYHFYLDKVIENFVKKEK